MSVEDLELGPTVLTFEIDDPRWDGSLVDVGRGVVLPSCLVASIETNKDCTVWLVVRSSRKGATLESLEVVMKEGAGSVTTRLLRDLGAQVSAATRYALRESVLMLKNYPVDLDSQDIDRVLIDALMPRPKSNESRAEYVYRLWVTEYKPKGRTQEELASDLGRGHDLVRKYVSQESRRQGDKL